MNILIERNVFFHLLQTEKLFVVRVAAVNQPPIEVSTKTYDVPISNTPNPKPVVIGYMIIVDPDLRENFTIKFDKPNYRALLPAEHVSTIIGDNSSAAFVSELAYFTLLNIDSFDLLFVSV